jgi:hypothetical protein
MRFVGSVHWLFPWLILILGMYILIKFVRGYLDGSVYKNVDARLVLLFTGLLDVQAVSGFFYFLLSRLNSIDYPHVVSIHAAIMFVAAVIPNFANRFKNAESSTRYLNTFYLLLASFLLMLVGLSLIPPK